MTKGDNAFNARDWAGVDAVHHQGYGRAHHRARRADLRITSEFRGDDVAVPRSFPDMLVNTPDPIQLGGGDWIT
jgi:hypothetical protein